MRTRRANVLFVLAAFATTAILALPVVLYLKTFGLYLSDDHKRWSEFGDAIGGMYSPIVSLLTLALLFMQLRIQKQHADELLVNQHVDHIRLSVDLYLDELRTIFDGEERCHDNLRKTLKKHFLHISNDDFSSEALREAANALRRDHPRLIILWTAYLNAVKILHTGEKSAFLGARSAATERAMVLLDFETCAALDNFHAIQTNQELDLIYTFSRSLRTADE